MGITHAKVSGLTNPPDPDLVGGEDWDDDHVVTGPRVLDCFVVFITAAGAILSQYGGQLTFSKTGTGAYRAAVPEDYMSSQPIIVASHNIPSAVPRFLLAALAEDTGTYYVTLLITDSDGAPVEISSGALSGIFCTAG